MCLAVLALDAHPRYRVVVAANRDEYHARPTAAASWWPEGVLAGRDLAAGGTWLGVTRTGRYALLTNVRDPSRHDPSAPSRGSLVPQLLASDAPVLAALDAVRRAGARQNGFNLLAGDAESAGWTSNRAADVRTLSAGVYGLSNATLDSDWPKVRRTKAAVAQWIAAGEDAPEPLLEALGDRTLASDDALPRTGVALEWERLLSAPFIVDARYGTRSSTVLTVDRAGEVRFVERSFDARGEASGEVRERFALTR
jgi:uncharacterized protein with NRDE domain